MNQTKLFLAMAAAGLLAGCATNIDQMKTVKPKGGNEFTASLTEEYRQLTALEAEYERDWIDANTWARKGLAASRGQAVQPEELKNWHLPADKVNELTQARARLVSALNGGAGQRMPKVAARAQVRFDCWVEQQEENHQPKDIAACRDGFYQAMEALGGRYVQPAGNVIYFQFNSADLTEAAQNIVMALASEIKQKNAKNVTVVGHTDLSGPASYNMTLSLRRADAVRSALVNAGVAPEQITTSGRGEEQPAVPTEDGVADRRNRRAEVLMQ